MALTVFDAAGSRRSVARLCATAATVFVLDIATKALAVGFIPAEQAVLLLGDRITLVVERNAGAALSIGDRYTLVCTVAVAAVVAVVFWRACRTDSKTTGIGAGLLVGGGLGNLGDRVFRAPGPLQGHVVDFLAVGGSPVFNAADVGIVCGALILGWQSAARRPAAIASGPSTGWSWEYRPVGTAYGRGSGSSNGCGIGSSISSSSASWFSSGGTGRVGRMIVGR